MSINRTEVDGGSFVLRKAMLNLKRPDQENYLRAIGGAASRGLLIMVGFLTQHLISVDEKKSASYVLEACGLAGTPLRISGLPVGVCV